MIYDKDKQRALEAIADAVSDESEKKKYQQAAADEKRISERRSQTASEQDAAISKREDATLQAPQTYEQARDAQPVNTSAQTGKSAIATPSAARKQTSATIGSATAQTQTQKDAQQTDGTTDTMYKSAMPKPTALADEDGNVTSLQDLVASHYDDNVYDDIPKYDYNPSSVGDVTTYRELFDKINADPTLTPEEKKRKRRIEIATKVLAGLGDIGSALGNLHNVNRGAAPIKTPNLSGMYKDYYDKQSALYAKSVDAYRNGRQDALKLDMQETDDKRKQYLSDAKFAEQQNVNLMRQLNADDKRERDWLALQLRAAKSDDDRELLKKRIEEADSRIAARTDRINNPSKYRSSGRRSSSSGSNKGFYVTGEKYTGDNALNSAFASVPDKFVNGFRERHGVGKWGKRQDLTTDDKKQIIAEYNAFRGYDTSGKYKKNQGKVDLSGIYK